MFVRGMFVSGTHGLVQAVLPSPLAGPVAFRYGHLEPAASSRQPKPDTKYFWRELPTTP